MVIKSCRYYGAMELGLNNVDEIDIGYFFFFQAEDGIRDIGVTGVQTCALPIFAAGAVNGWGGAGAFPHARISSVRVFPRHGGASWQDYIRAITRCLKLDAATKVIVISIGGQNIDPGEADELEAHVEQARNLYNVNVVAAVGNGSGAVDFPARFESAIAVAGAAREGELCAFSARGPGVDVTAPGCGLHGADVTGRP